MASNPGEDSWTSRALETSFSGGQSAAEDFAHVTNRVRSASESSGEGGKILSFFKKKQLERETQFVVAMKHKMK